MRTNISNLRIIACPFPADLGRKIMMRAGALIALLACLTTSPGVQAQPQAVDECVGQSSQSEEIACLRQALKEKSDALAHTRQAVSEDRRDTAQPQVVAPSAGKPARAAEALAVPKGEPRVAAASRAEGLGSEQLPGRRLKDEDDDKSATLQAVVASAQEDQEGLLRLTLENGQVWKQSERPSTQIILKKAQRYAVEISKSGFGGYRMRFQDLGRTIVVKRIS